MIKSIVTLRNIYRGKKIYVIASGKSIDFIPRNFFDGEIVIAVNDMYLKFPNATFTLRKEYEGLNEVIMYKKQNNCKFDIVASQYDCGGHLKKNDAPGEYYYFKHGVNLKNKIRFDAFQTSDYLVVSESTITSAIHFAYYLGAKHIILCGHDCGSIDGQFNLSGYMQNSPIYSYPLPPEEYTLYEPQTKQLAQYLRDQKDVSVVSINPWINFGLEGHKYKRGTEA